jgi:hypothetical protein
VVRALFPSILESGFGATISATTTLTTNYDRPNKLIGTQMMWLFYPETAYGQAMQWPTLHESMDVLSSSTSGSTTTVTWAYPVNPLSVAGNRLHFTPLWFPDGPYTVLAQAFYAWSPIGQMVDYGIDSVTIEGDIYDRIAVVRK